MQSRDEYERDVVNGFTRNDHLYSYHSADDRLTVANRHLGISAVSADGTVGQRGVFETFRYDALGRRVATLSQRGPGCVQSHTECFPYLERTVWDGDQLLYEIRASNYGGSSGNDLAAGGAYNAYGRVLYLHGGGIDTPLAVTRLNLYNQPTNVSTAPHADWQGDYVNGTLMSGAVQGNCTGAYTCPVVTWPGGRQTTDGVLLSDAPATTGWWGSLMQGQADASGLRYQRNRFYDPTTGQFTQQDPIGFAGGRNLYAFAGGDPINFRDPFGLFECNRRTGEGCSDEYRRLLSVDGGIEPVDNPVEYLFLAGSLRRMTAKGILKSTSRIDVSVRGTVEYAKLLFRNHTGEKGLEVMRDTRMQNRITGVRTSDGAVILRFKKGKDGVIANVEVINEQGTRVNIHVRP